VVPSEPDVHGPPSAANLILDEEGLPTVRTAIVKREIRRNIGIEFVVVSNRVGELLSCRSRAHVRAGLPLMQAPVAGNRSVFR
jgi:hypothetical protein